jgi:hypothetical protein
MTREQPEREIKGCQLGFVTGVPVHEQSANMVYSTFQRSLAKFRKGNVTPNITTTYTMLKWLLRGNQQYKNMKLVFNPFS